jgi:hypothetical protein
LEKAGENNNLDQAYALLPTLEKEFEDLQSVLQETAWINP